MKKIQIWQLLMDQHSSEVHVHYVNDFVVKKKFVLRSINPSLVSLYRRRASFTLSRFLTALPPFCLGCKCILFTAHLFLELNAAAGQQQMEKKIAHIYRRVIYIQLFNSSAQIAASYNVKRQLFHTFALWHSQNSHTHIRRC